MEKKTYQIYKLKNVKYIFSIEKGEEINYTLDVYEYICSFNIKREHELLKEHTGTERDNKFLENFFDIVLRGLNRFSIYTFLFLF